jgi:hypothetical protein
MENTKLLREKAELCHKVKRVFRHTQDGGIIIDVLFDLLASIIAASHSVEPTLNPVVIADDLATRLTPLVKLYLADLSKDSQSHH